MEENDEKSAIAHAMESGLLLGGLFIVRDVAEMLVYASGPSLVSLCLLSAISILSFVGTVYIVMTETLKAMRTVLEKPVLYLGIVVYCVYIFSFGALLYAVYLSINLLLFNPDLLATQREFYDGLFTQLSTMEGTSTEILTRLKEGMDKAFSEMAILPPPKFAVDSMLGIISNGFLLSLVMSIILYKKQ